MIMVGRLDSRKKTQKKELKEEEEEKKEPPQIPQNQHTFNKKRPLKHISTIAKVEPFYENIVPPKKEVNSYNEGTPKIEEQQRKSEGKKKRKEPLTAKKRPKLDAIQIPGKKESMTPKGAQTPSFLKRMTSKDHEQEFNFKDLA